MAAVELANQAVIPNGGFARGALATDASVASSDKKKARESERRRRRRKQKSSARSQGVGEESEPEGSQFEKESKASSAHREDVTVEVEYVPEKADIDESFIEEFKNVIEKFNFRDDFGREDDAKKDETAGNATAKKGDSDSEEDEQEVQQKEKGLSNKKKKLQKRMKIAELKQISSRPDVVEVWDATAGDPKLLVFLKSYRNTVPVPRHWCQKRKFLQGPAVTMNEPQHQGNCQRAFEGSLF